MHSTVYRIISILVFCLLMPPAWAFEIERVNVSSTGEVGNAASDAPSMSADGRFVAFESLANNLVVGDTNNKVDIFVHDRDTGVTERVSVSSNGSQANGESDAPSMSADGRFVAFSSRASNLVTGDTNGDTDYDRGGDIFVHDRDTGRTERVSVSSAGVQGFNVSYSPSISADGHFVAFTSRASNLVVGDTNNKHDIFVYDRVTEITERVSVSSVGAQTDNLSHSPSMSADGRFVVFLSWASNLVVGDTDGYWDIFVHDRVTRMTERVSVSSDGNQAKGSSLFPSISADGRFVVFESYAANLVADYTIYRYGIFVHDRDTGMTERVNVNSLNSRSSSISADGRFVVFQAYYKTDIFVHDRDTGKTERVSVSTVGDQGNDESALPSISADGGIIAFNSKATNLVADDVNGEPDVFVTENSLFKLAGDLSVSLRRTSGATQVGEYIHFRARLTNTTDQALTNCKAVMFNPKVKGRREFRFFSWPLNVSNPTTNAGIDIAPGETGQFVLAVVPRVVMRKEVSFTYGCDSTQAYRIPFLNTAHLTAKTEPLISEDYVSLSNAYPKLQLVIDRSNGKYWTGYTVKVQNNGAQPASVNLGASSDLLTNPSRLRAPFLCEPADPANGDWSCLAPRAQQLQVDLAVGELKTIRVYVHAYRAIEQFPVKHRVFIEARDQAGEIVAKTGIGVSTLD